MVQEGGGELQAAPRECGRVSVRSLVAIATSLTVRPPQKMPPTGVVWPAVLAREALPWSPRRPLAQVTFLYTLQTPLEPVGDRSMTLGSAAAPHPTLCWQLCGPERPCASLCRHVPTPHSGWW